MDEKPRSYKYAAFISYSRKDTPFARALEKALDNYKPPKIEGLPQQRLNVFRDENDLIGADYFKAIDGYISNSARLILVCSPRSGHSQYVNDEVKRFAEKNGAENIIPVIIDGIPNNEVEEGRGREEDKAFPPALCEALAMPLAIDYLKFDPAKEKVNKGLRENSWYSILARIFEVSREEIEQRDKKRQQRQRRIRGAIAGVVAVVVIALLAWGWITEIDKRKAEERDRNYTQAKTFEEKAGRALQEQSSEGYQKAWLYTLAALEQKVDTTKSLDISRGRLNRKAISSGASIDQQAWVSPRQPLGISAITASAVKGYFATIGSDGKIRLWNAHAGEEISNWETTSDTVSGIAINADGTRLACIVSENSTLLWNLEKPDSPVFIDSLSTGVLNAVAFAPDGQYLAGATQDGAIQLFDIKERDWFTGFFHKLFSSGKSTLADLGNSPAVQSMTFSPDGKFLLCGMSDRTLRRVNVGTDNIETIAGDNGVSAKTGFNGVSWSTGGTYLAAAANDSAIYLWEKKGEGDSSPKPSIRLSDGVASSVAFISETQAVIVSPEEGIRLWDLNSGEEIARTTGHKTPVNCVAYNLDGSILASGSDDGAIILWDAASGAETRRLEKNLNVIEALAFSKDGRWLASGSKDGRVCIWNVASGECEKEVPQKLVRVWSVTFSPGDSILAIALDRNQTKGNNLYLWNLNGDEVSEMPPAHQLGVNGVAFNHAGNRLVSVSRDSTLCLWDVKSKEQIVRWQGHEDQVYGVAYCPNDTLVASAATDETARLWNIQKVEALLGESEIHDEPGRKFIRSFNLRGAKGDSAEVRLIGNMIEVRDFISKNIWNIPRPSHGNSFWKLALSYSDEPIFYRIDGNSIELRYEREVLKKVLRGHIDEVWDVAFSPNGKLLASASGDRSIRLWSVETGVELANLNGHARDVFGVAFSPDGRHLASASFDNTVRLWDMNRAFNPNLFISCKDTVRSLAFSKDKQYFASAGHDKRVRLYPIKSDTVDIRNPRSISNWTTIMSVAFSPDNQFIAYGAADNKIRLWDYAGKSKERVDFKLEGDGLSVVFSPDSSLLTSGSSDKLVRIWKMKDILAGQNKEWAVLDRHRNKVRSVAFSRDSKYLATASSDKMIYLYEVDKENPNWKEWKAKPLPGHNDGVWGVAFSPNGKLLASGSWDTTIRLWDVNGGEKTATLRGHQGPVMTVVFLNDTTLLSGSRDQTIRMWNIITGSQVDIFHVHSEAVYSIAASGRLPSGVQYLASGSGDRSIRLLEITQKKSSIDTLGSAGFSRLYTAFEYLLPYRMKNDNLSEEPLSFYLTPLNGYEFPDASYRKFHRPRPLAQDPRQWALEWMVSKNGTGKGRK